MERHPALRNLRRRRGDLDVAGLVAHLNDRDAAAVEGVSVVGFVGVVFVLNPSAASLTPPALVAIAGSMIFSVLMVVTRGRLDYERLADART